MLRNMDKLATIFILFHLIFMCLLNQNIKFAYASEQRNNPSSLRKLEDEIGGITNKFEIPGACIAVVGKDSLHWIGCFGFANLANQEPITENTLFRMASISKTFIALAFQKLVEEGKIDLYAPIREIIPEIEYSNPWEETDPVRIVHLLEHTSGFDAAHFYEYYNLNEKPNILLKDVLLLNPKARKVRWKPGTRIAYTNHGYAIAGYILEKITGQSFEDYLKHTILEPIGMTSSTFAYLNQGKADLAQGYTFKNQIFPYKPFYLRPASSLKSSVKDMARFVQFMLNRGKVCGQNWISETSLGRMERTETSSAAKRGFKLGYGLGIKTNYRNGYKYFSFSGGIPDFTSVFAYVKELGFGCVVMINNSNVEAFYKIYQLIIKYITQNVQPSIKPVVKTSPEQMVKFSGYYDYLNPDEQLSAMLYALLSGTTITFENDTLYQQDFMAEKKALVPVSVNTFRRSEEPDASIIFFEDEEGNMIMSDMSAYYMRSNRWKPIFLRIFIFGAIFIMVLQILYALFWIPIFFIRKSKNTKIPLILSWIRVLTLLASLLLVFSILILRPETPQDILNFGQKNFDSITFYISTVLFAGFSILSLLLYILSYRKPITFLPSLYYGLAVLSSCGLTIYLYYWGIIGLRLWAY